MISKKHKESIAKLIKSNDVTHWSLALQILLGQTRRNDAESMIVQYIINTHSNCFGRKMINDIEDWLTDKIHNEKLRKYFRKNFKYISGLREQLDLGSQMVHDGNLTMAELMTWVNGVSTSRRKKNVTLTCGHQTAKLFDQIMKEEVNK